MKYIIVTGGVISGLGKGITASSIGLLMKSRGLNVTAIKIDPYLNLDAGTMSPYEHGETYVLSDGSEVDLDLGNYERFLNINLSKNHNITTGKIYKNVLDKERKGDYLGKTVQIIPHITDEIKRWIKETSVMDVGYGEPNVCIIELGGTIGDIETAPFVEALRQMSINEDCCFVHVSMIINNGEPKTKPTQQSVRLLRSLGIVPNMLVLRTNELLSDNILDKLEINCQIKKSNIISNTNVPNIYYVPDLFRKQNVCDLIANVLNIKLNIIYDIGDYENILNHYLNCQVYNYRTINVGIAGKYTGSQDTYLSLIRAIEHASFHCKVRFNIIWINVDNNHIDNSHINDNKLYLINKIKKCDRIIIPGGFGTRGIDGKIFVAKYCRENNIPILGICLGMQIMVVEYARFLGYHNAVSGEWLNNTNNDIMKVIDIIPTKVNDMGGSMRLGNYKTKLTSDKLKELYGCEYIVERHRHRYEFSDKYANLFRNSNMLISGINEINKLVEVIELNNHRYYIGCQYHPEFKSRFNKPHPLFVGLLNC